MIQTYPGTSEQRKPKERHCLIDYFQGDAVEEPVMGFLIEDDDSISKIIALGFKRKNMQSLMMTDHYQYVTTDTLRCDDSIEDIYKAGEKLCKELIESNGFSVPKSFDTFCFSFPDEMIDEFSNIIEKDNQTKI